MGEDLISRGTSRKKSKVGILIGIPFLLFIAGIALISVAGYNNLKFAFYFSGLFIQDETVVHATSISEKVENKEGTAVTFPKFGQQYAEINIESAGIVAPVYCGDSDEILLKGIGQFYGSVFPGEQGNTVLAGHRNSLFKTIGNAKIGDTVVLKANYGTYTYKISDIKIKKGTDQSIVAPTETAKLTMYTCYPFDYIGSAPNRYVVTCDLVDGPSLESLGFDGGIN